MNKATLRKPPFWASVFTLAGFLVLCGLGGWQVQRAAWKDKLIAARDTLLAQPPAPYDGPRLRHAVTTGAQSPFLAYITVQGAYLHDRSLLIGPRTRGGESGFHLVTPLLLADGTALLVNRGWTYRTTIPAAAPAPAKVTGHLRVPEKPNRFVPANDPAHGQWYSFDIPAMARYTGQPALLPAILYATEEDPVSETAYLHENRPYLPANHRAYAFFWFSMAGVLLAIYALRFLRPQRP